MKAPRPRLVRRRAVTVFPAYYPSTQSYYPSGRVYVYLPKSPEK